MFDPVYKAIAWLLALFYSVIPNLGVSIILLTFTIMLLLFPLTAKQAKSMIAMQRVQPEIKKLQAKYKGDRQKLNEEMMKFYQENKINPLAGCLPLVLQLPIFFALFRVLRDSYKYVPLDSKLFADLCTNKAGKLLSVNQCGKVGVTHLDFMGIDLAKSAVDPHSSVWAAIPYFLLVGLVVLTGYLQSRQAQKRTPAANKQMAIITKVLPVFFGFISLQFPAGLVLYFFVSNLWRLGQQEVIFRRFQAGVTGGAKPTIGAGGEAATATAVIDVDSRDRADGEGDGDDAEPEAPRKPLRPERATPRAATPAPRQKPKPAPAPAPAPRPERQTGTRAGARAGVTWRRLEATVPATAARRGQRIEHERACAPAVSGEEQWDRARVER